VQITHEAISGSDREFGGSAGSWISTQFGRLVSRMAARHRTATQIRQLDRLTDRELRDMGLNRSDLPAIINGTYRRD
jgi:uncharacterized protein YjiS (DUF1127 family)